MSHLIIGHVTASSARIWVRGSRTSGNAVLRFRVEGGSGAWNTATADLQSYRDYSSVIELTGLQPATFYACELSYAAGNPPPVPTGRFRTAPAVQQDIGFLLGSCAYARLRILTSKDVEAAWTRIGQLVTHVGPDFMIQCGDQIYADLPREPYPDLPYYQRQYRQAWGFAPAARVLASVPHYMMLDDHEVFDNFANDTTFPDPRLGNAAAMRAFGLEAYRQYQHAHNPQTSLPPALHYAFDFGGAFFFALDCRSERWAQADTQMISAAQMGELKSWLSAHAPDPKFVITSVPFVGEVRSSEGADKWCGAAFRPQREEILDHLAANGIGRLCFLTGDMHASYHAEMQVTPPAGGSFKVHELMSSPINQVTSGLHSFLEAPPERTTAGGTKYRTLPFAPGNTYTAHSNVMAIRFAHAGSVVSWEIYRTKAQTLPPAAVASGSFSL